MSWTQFQFRGLPKPVIGFGFGIEIGHFNFKKMIHGNQMNSEFPNATQGKSKVRVKNRHLTTTVPIIRKKI